MGLTANEHVRPGGRLGRVRVRAAGCAPPRLVRYDHTTRMEDGTLALEVLLDFAKQGFDLWSEYLGSNVLERAANTTWKHMTNMEGGAGRVIEALTRMFPEQIGDHQKLCNLLTAYELWSGYLLTSPAWVFVQDGLSSVLEPGWEVQLQ